MIEKYDGKDDPCTHLAKWAWAYGAKPQPKSVHLLCNTLNVILMNWYLETELHHGTGEWGILLEGFIIIFNFEDEFDCIDKALEEVKAIIFRMSQDLLEIWRNR